MKKIIETWEMPDRVDKISYVTVTIDDGLLRLEISGPGYSASLGGRRITYEEMEGR